LTERATTVMSAPYGSCGGCGLSGVIFMRRSTRTIWFSVQLSGRWCSWGDIGRSWLGPPDLVGIIALVA
jgi:hypothetical protein